jgi:hypothetical protein
VTRAPRAPFAGTPGAWCGERHEDLQTALAGDRNHAALEKVRAETLTYLRDCTEERLETPIPLPEAWYEYFGGARVIEPEELMRRVARHEYYHLGQLITYRWQRGNSPLGG